MLIEGVSGDVLKTERGAAPAAAARNRSTGRPRVAVRPYYGGLPSMAGRGMDEGRRKLPGSGAQQGPVRARKLRPRGRKSPRWSAERRAFASQAEATRLTRRVGWLRQPPKSAIASALRFPALRSPHGGVD
jgi:hypothetical protein